MQIKIKKTFAAPLLVFAICVLLAILNTVSLSDLTQRASIYIAVIIMQIIIFMIPGILYCKLRGNNFVRSLRINLFTPEKLWITVFALFLLISGSSLVKVGLYTLDYYSTQYTLYERFVPNSIGNFGDLVYIIIALALLPAITEEFVFRGIILGEYTLMGCSNTTAIMLSALLFSLTHLNMYQLPVYFYAGIVLAFVAITTNSILCTVIIHFLSNCYSLLFESQLINLISQTDSVIFVLFVLSIVFLVFLILLLQATERIYYAKGIRGEPSPELKPRKKKKNVGFKYDINAQAWISPSMILCIVAFIIITLVVK